MLAVATIGAIGLTPFGDATVGAEGQPTAASEAARALDRVNLVRQLSHVPPAGLDEALRGPAEAHACWMTANDVLSHGETVGTVGYSAAGNVSAQKSNVAVSSSGSMTPEAFVDLWLTGPYHALGILDPDLRRTGFGQCTDALGKWRSGAALDVLSAVTPTAPGVVTFPGDQSVVPWTKFVAETPNPVKNCASNGVQWTSAGLPLLATAPEAPAASATATLIGPGGALEVCVLTQHNDHDTAGASMLANHRAVVVLPRDELADGQYFVTVNNGSRVISWSFRVSSAVSSPYLDDGTQSASVGPLSSPSTFVAHGPERTWDTRLGAGVPLISGVEYQMPVGTPPPGAAAVVVTVTTTKTDASGWLAVYPCGQFAGTSLSNFAAGRTNATTVVVALGQAGVCVRSYHSTHVIADVAGWMTEGMDGAGFVPGESRRYDSRSGIRPAAGTVVRVNVADPGVVAVSLNVTTVSAVARGFVTVWGCESIDEPPPTASVGQARLGGAQASSGIVPVATDGSVCLYSSAEFHLIVDVTGSFITGDGAAFVAFAPVRRYDSRELHQWQSPTSPGIRVPASSELPLDFVMEGLPVSTVSVLANITLTKTIGAGWAGLGVCGQSGSTSDINVVNGDTVANVATIGTPQSVSCLTLTAPAHLVIDVYGAFVD